MVDYDLAQMKKSGCRVYIKSVKGNDYIVARHTLPGLKKRVSKSLGPFDLDLWLQLEALGMTPKTTQKEGSLPNQPSVLTINDMQRQFDSINAQNKSENKRLREYMNKRLKGLSKRVKEQEKKKLFWKDVISEERGASLRDLEFGNEIVMDFMINWVKRLDKKIEILEKEIGVIPA